ncbi:TatD family hydrolase [Pelistega europaea]|uniref:TatD family hydrolase n=1 Tax=Pelistega europaea TaxID=106147 RepID=A0A7Y4P723_9BURK|nr:TatD family hydrolase [Pelistega europaea]NOL50310.1 TatD family hydrolase [Pelistega europaea]
MNYPITMIDTHCHLDAPEFNLDREQVIAKSVETGVNEIVIPAVAKFNFQTVQRLAWQFDGGYYALGIHPMYVHQSQEEDLSLLEAMIKQALASEDPRLVAIGEIGLDFFVPEIKEGVPRQRQEFFYREQLKLAQRYDLPVLLHVRRSQDMVLKYLRQVNVVGGIAHAFNGSEQQAQYFMDLGFCLGFGGAMTFSRALQIRRLAAQVPLQYIVLETDAPDIPPAWLTGNDKRNSPSYLPRIAEELAKIRGVSLEEVAQVTNQNARRVMPRLLTSSSC